MSVWLTELLTYPRSRMGGRNHEILEVYRGRGFIFVNLRAGGTDDMTV